MVVCTHPPSSDMSQRCHELRYGGAVHILDDPTVSPRVQALLSRARRLPAMPESAIRARVAGTNRAGEKVDVPTEVVEAMVAFESRYGGMVYPLLGSNGIEWGLDGEAEAFETEFGWAFAPICDGDWTWPRHVLADGRIAIDLGPPNSYQITNSSAAQRIECDALTVEVRQWPHRALSVDLAAWDTVEASGLTPQRVPEASGPEDNWWHDGRTAVHARPGPPRDAGDTSLVRWFARDVADLDATVAVALAVPGVCDTGPNWCVLCGHHLAAGQTCIPGDVSS